MMHDENILHVEMRLPMQNYMFVGGVAKWVVRWPLCSCLLSPCLVFKKFYKIFQISRHIESLDACMEY